MNCPKCDASIAPENVNIQALVAKCDKCGEVFRVTDELPEAFDDDDQEPVRFPQPPTLVVQEAGDVRVIRRRWFRPMHVILLFFCIAWDSFLVFWYSMAIFAPGPGPFDIIAIVFPIFHVAVGIGLSYTVIAGFLNKSYIGVTNDGLYIRHRPIPWPGNMSLPTESLKELYVERSYTQSTSNRAPQQMYSLNAVVEDGKTRKVLGGLELAEARFCVQTLSEWLKLPASRLGVRLMDER
jgi:hypothetical protein